MNFSRFHVLALLLVLASGATSCRRTITAEERAARTEVRTALRERAFTRALPPARRVLQFAPNDNGAWARLAQAQFGLRDLAGLRETLEKWRRAVRRTSPKYDEYRGDLALAEGRPDEALIAWGKAVTGKNRLARIHLKIARLEQSAGRWERAALAWTRGMQPRASSRALVNRALCYQHLHSWEAARADLQRAGQLDPEDPLVRRETAHFDRLGKFLDEVRKLDKELIASPNDVGLLTDRALLFLRADGAALALDDARKAA
ncbi:MAG: tetratricopeptide repeat protein, partial [Chthoniobacterales bacterium]